ncbi:MAG: tetratricopeptide repeat protein [Anaerolineae bacterium]|nr:tetratricopeptide repeat protein [Anaerolineae bacterium]
MRKTAQSPGTDRTTSLGYGDYLRFAHLVQDYFGLYFSEKRRPELEQGVRRAFAASICADLGEYYRLLQDPVVGAVHREQLVNALTVCETHFFRNETQCDALCRHVLPEIIDCRRHLRTLRVWSAGCASGEEPYSIAMLLRDLLPDVDQWSVTILGTDVNTEALDRARRGVYSHWAFREKRAKEWRSRFFRQEGSRWALQDEVKRMVTFAPLNLAEGHYPSYETNTRFLDLILCRNVTIYFTETVTRQVVARFYEALLDGGWLVVGHAEHSLTIYQQFQAHNFPGAILYQRTGQPVLPAQDWPLPGEAPAAPPARVQVPAAPQRAAAPAPLPAPLPQEGDPVEQAREWLDYGRSEEARVLLERVVAADPRRAEAWMLLGQACANLGRWEDAEEWCRKAVELDTLALPAYYALALVLQHQGRVGEAIEAMKKVVYIDRDHVLAHFGLADLYHDNGQLPQALKSLDNARRLLEGQAEGSLIPGSGGVTVERLKETVVRQQQQWVER